MARTTARRTYASSRNLSVSAHGWGRDDCTREARPGSAHRGKDAMTPTRPTARSGSYYPFILLLLSLGCLVWAFWPTLTDLGVLRLEQLE